jgi:hypothetical protein
VTLLRLLALAGIVGIVRQRREATAVRAGIASVRGPATEDDFGTPPGPMARRAAEWLPAPASRTTTRALTALWAAPLSALGLALAAVGGGRVHWDARRGCIVATGVHGPSAWALRFVGADANTIGQVVLCRSETPSPALLDHEAVHVRQAERLGPLLLPAYVWWNARYGYADNPLERAARTGAAGSGAPPASGIRRSPGPG